MRKLEIYNEDNYPKSVIVTGAGRSGKTSLCKIWASTKGVEWLEEPNSLIVICYSLLMKENNETTGIDSETCEALWGHTLREYINSIVLGREGLNFRPGDLSSVWEFKSVSEIMERLYLLKNRDDVIEYISRNSMLFLIDIPEMVSPLTALSGAKFNSSVLAVVRNPSDVASDVEKKGWYGDKNLLNPLRGNNYSYKFEYNNKLYRLPFWLKEQDAEVFIKSSDFARGLIYWLSISEGIINCGTSVNEIVIYEDMVRSPMNTIEWLCDKYGGVITDTTNSLCNIIQARKIKRMLDKDFVNSLSDETKERLLVCCEYFGYV